MKRRTLVKWTNLFIGFSWGDDAFSIALGPIAFTWDRTTVRGLLCLGGHWWRGTPSSCCPICGRRASTEALPSQDGAII